LQLYQSFKIAAVALLLQLGNKSNVFFPLDFLTLFSFLVEILYFSKHLTIDLTTGSSRAQSPLGSFNYQMLENMNYIITKFTDEVL